MEKCLQQPNNENAVLVNVDYIISTLRDMCKDVLMRSEKAGSAWNRLMKQFLKACEQNEKEKAQNVKPLVDIMKEVLVSSTDKDAEHFVNLVTFCSDFSLATCFFFSFFFNDGLKKHVKIPCVRVQIHETLDSSQV